MWVLSYKGLRLQATKDFPIEVWESLTRDRIEAAKDRFEPVDPAKQDVRRSWAREELKRINFWDRVQRMGVKKHSHPKVDRVSVGADGTITIIMEEDD